MDTVVVSNVILWIVVIVLGLVVLALARQVGTLHERVAPAGALMPTCLLYTSPSPRDRG